MNTGQIRASRTHVGRCEVHDKLSYSDRKRARAVARLHPEHKSVYRCSVNETHWHVGGLPLEVREGYMTRDEKYWRAA